MKKKEVEKLERCISQIDALCKEIMVLSKKSPNDAVSPFKLRFVNRVLEEVNDLLDKKFSPFDDFTIFEDETAPSNSDVVFMLSQYAGALDLFRSENIYHMFGDTWGYTIEDPDVGEDGESKIVRTRPPVSLSKKAYP